MNKDSLLTICSACNHSSRMHGGLGVLMADQSQAESQGLAEARLTWTASRVHMHTPRVLVLTISTQEAVLPSNREASLRPMPALFTRMSMPASFHLFTMMRGKATTSASCASEQVTVELQQAALVLSPGCLCQQPLCTCVGASLFLQARHRWV